MRVAVYLRVSSSEQNASNQLPALQAFAESKCWEISEVYQEQESAWRNGHQRELTRLMKDAQRRRFDILLVWSLDRLTREGALAILLLFHKLIACGVKLISLQESWTELPNELRDVFLAMTGWVAQFESKRRSERTKAGLERAKREGKKLGRPLGSKDRKKRKQRNWINARFL